MKSPSLFSALKSQKRMKTEKELSEKSEPFFSALRNRLSRLIIKITQRSQEKTVRQNFNLPVRD